MSIPTTTTKDRYQPMIPPSLATRAPAANQSRARRQIATRTSCQFIPLFYDRGLTTVNPSDDAAIESDNSETEAHDSDIGSDTRSIRDIDEDRGSDSGTDTQSMHDNDCEPPTPAQPPHRQPSPISSTPPHSPSPDPQTPVKSPPKSSARAGTKSKQPTRVLGVDRTGKLASVSATPTESTKGGDQAAASTGSFKRLVKGRRTFGSVMSKPSDKATAGEVYLADLEYISFKTLPDVCAVTDLRLQDPELMHTYADRPNLK